MIYQIQIVENIHEIFLFFKKLKKSFFFQIFLDFY
jgi:hypothetical protein